MIKPVFRHLIDPAGSSLAQLKAKIWSNEYARHGAQKMLAAIGIESGNAAKRVNKARNNRFVVSVPVTSAVPPWLKRQD